MDHLPNHTAQLSRFNMSVRQDITDCKFTLVALCRATSAKLKNLDQDIHTELEALQSEVIKEEQALGWSECIKALPIAILS